MNTDNLVCACMCPQEGFWNFTAVSVYSCVFNTLYKNYNILCSFYE